MSGYDDIQTGAVIGYPGRLAKVRLRAARIARSQLA